MLFESVSEYQLSYLYEGFFFINEERSYYVVYFEHAYSLVFSRNLREKDEIS